MGDRSTVSSLDVSTSAFARRAGVFLSTVLLAFLIAAPAWARYSDIVIDAKTGQVLHETNADLKNYPASLTKLMTLYLTFEAIDQGRLTWDSMLPVSAHAAAQAPTKLGLTPGSRISVQDLVFGLVTKSANDGAVVLGETLGGSEPKFGDVMTAKAHALGMGDTSFKNASGLPNLRQMTTARDMAKLALALQRDFPQDYHYFSTREFNYKGTVIRNHNNLLGKVDGVDGMKTGFIQASGFNLVASAERNGRRYIAVVLGGETVKVRDQEVAALLEHAFAGDLTPGTTRVAALPNVKTTQAKVKVAAAPAPKTLPAKPTTLAANASTISPMASLGETITNWAVQVGAFARQDSARDAASKASKQLAQLASDAEVAVVGTGKTLYRARIVGLSEASAQEACRFLRQKGTDCVTIGPASAGHSLAAVPN
jgi:D-alanyl-D-alanine carboxypeptidase